MSQQTFEKNSLGWQIYQFSQRFKEWWELQTNKLSDNLPDIPLFSWLDSKFIINLAQLLFWLIVTILLVWLGLSIVRFLERYYWNLQNNSSTLVSNISQKNQFKKLTYQGWLAKSKEYQQQNNYHQACLCLYQAMLQKLNDTGIIPDEKSRTDGEYLKLIWQLPNPQPYQTLLMIHQLLCFAKTSATVEIFTQCQAAFHEIDAP